MCECECVCVCVRACMCAYAYVCVCGVYKHKSILPTLYVSKKVRVLFPPLSPHNQLPSQMLWVAMLGVRPTMWFSWSKSICYQIMSSDNNIPWLTIMCNNMQCVEQPWGFMNCNIPSQSEEFCVSVLTL